MTSIMHSDPNELISALVDGKVSPNELSGALASLKHGEAARDRWDTYHLIGDTMRGLDAGPSLSSSVDFAARFRIRLTQEKALDETRTAARTPPLLTSPVHTLAPSQAQSANDALFRWKVVSGLASVMAVAVMGWHWMGGTSLPASGQQSASATSSSQAAMIRDPRLDRLLAAHQQHSGFSDSHMTSGFLRHATYAVSEP